MNGGDEEGVQRIYCRLRRLLIDHPLLSDREVRSPKRELPAADSEHDSFLAEFVRTGYGCRLRSVSTFRGAPAPPDSSSYPIPAAKEASTREPPSEYLCASTGVWKPGSTYATKRFARTECHVRTG